jgi:hypothetical protein
LQEAVIGASVPLSPVSWFRSRAGRRYGLELALVVLAKIALLLALYFLFIAPQARTDTSPSSVQQHLLDGAPAAAARDTHDRP